MIGKKIMSQPPSSGNKSTDLPSMDSAAYDDESLKLNKSAVYHQSTSIETLAKYTISVLDPYPSIQPSPLVDNCLEHLKIEAEKKKISKQSKQSAESYKVLIVSEESSESKYNVQKGPQNKHLYLNFHFNAPVTHISLILDTKSLVKLCQSTNDNLPQIQLKVHSQHIERNVAAKRKGEEADEESNSSQISRYSKMSKRRKSRSMCREKNTIENEEICTCKHKCCRCNASTSKDTAKHKNASGKQCPRRRIAAVFDLRNRSKKKEAVKSKRKPKSKTKKSMISKSQGTLSQWLI